MTEYLPLADDLRRFLLGDQPPLFLVEIIVRTTIIYAYTLGLLRWLGSRTVGQLSTVEFLLVIALGSAVGDAMFYPDVPLLHAMLVVTLVVIANKSLDWMIAHSKRAEQLVDGGPCEAIRDGVLSRSFLKNLPIGRDELFQELREDGIEQLGEVRRAYVEKDGEVTVFRVKGAIPAGLRIVPPAQIEPYHLVHPNNHETQSAALVCVGCGRKWEGIEHCDTCEVDQWTPSTD